MQSPMTIEFFGTTTEVARSNIVHSLGDGLWGNNISQKEGETNPLAHVKMRGMFTPYDKKTFGSITDGASNTIGMSEAIGTNRSATQSTRDVLGDVAQADDMYNGSLSLPAPCLNMRSPTDRTQLINTTNSWRAGFFTDGRGANAAFTTHLPPNSPSCSWWWPNAGHDSWGAFSVSSYHTGGVNMVRMDGSCAFISETIDTGTLTTPLDIKVSASPYGVWGALGTPQGGESVSL
jgi:hypothetical protein